MTSVKSYFATVEYHRDKFYMCNASSNCLFLIKFCKKNFFHMCSIVTYHTRAVVKKKFDCFTLKMSLKLTSWCGHSNDSKK